VIEPVWFTGRADPMGAYRNRPLTNLAAIAGKAAVRALNVVLLLQTAGMSL
jgi:manganese transport protein